MTDELYMTCSKWTATAVRILSTAPRSPERTDPFSVKKTEMIEADERNTFGTLTRDLNNLRSELC